MLSPVKGVMLTTQVNTGVPKVYTPVKGGMLIPSRCGLEVSLS